MSGLLTFIINLDKSPDKLNEEYDAEFMEVVAKQEAQLLQRDRTISTHYAS